MSVSAPPSGNIRLDGSITAAGKGGVCIPTTAKNDQFKKLRALRDNQICFDCANTRPTWASVNHGTFKCGQKIAKFDSFLNSLHHAVHRSVSVFGLLCHAPIHGCTSHVCTISGS